MYANVLTFYIFDTFSTCWVVCSLKTGANVLHLGARLIFIYLDFPRHHLPPFWWDQCQPIRRQWPSYNIPSNPGEILRHVYLSSWWMQCLQCVPTPRLNHCLLFVALFWQRLHLLQVLYWLNIAITFYAFYLSYACCKSSADFIWKIPLLSL